MRHPPAGDPFAVWLRRWGLRPDGEAIMTAGSSLLPVRRGGTPAMLKIAHEDEERYGAGLMVWWAGRGAAPVLECEGEALLMARATGPRSLAELSRSGEAGDDEAMRILCGALAALHAPRPEPTPEAIPLERWFAPLLLGHGCYGGLTTACAETANRLLAERREPVVLHGDMHHGNLLDFAERGWLAIDPKRLRGERAFDYANLFRNPDGETVRTGGSALLAGRIAVTSQASGLEPRRLLDWTMAFAGLSSVWLRDDGEAANDDLLVAGLAASLAQF